MQPHWNNIFNSSCPGLMHIYIIAKCVRQTWPTIAQCLLNKLDQLFIPEQVHMPLTMLQPKIGFLRLSAKCKHSKYT